MSGITPYSSTTPMQDQLIPRAPNELVFEVFKFIDFRTLAVLCCVNKKLLHQVTLFLPYDTIAGIKEIKSKVENLADSDKKDSLVLEIVRLEMKNALKDAFATALTIKNPELRTQAVMEIFSAIAAKNLRAAKAQAQGLRDLQLRDSARVGIVKAEATKALNAAKKTASIIKDESLRNEAYIEIVKAEATINLKNARKTAKTLDEYSNSRGSCLSPQKRALLEVIKVEAAKDLSTAFQSASAYRTATNEMGRLYGINARIHHQEMSDLAFIEIIKVYVTKYFAFTPDVRDLSQRMWGNAFLEIIKIQVSKDLNAARATHRFMNTTMPEYNQALLEIVKEMAKINTEEASKIISSMTPHLEYNDDALKEWKKYHSIALLALKAENSLDSAKEYVMDIKDVDLRDDLLIEIIKKEALRNPFKAQKTAAEIGDPEKRVEAYLEIVKLAKVPKVDFSFLQEGRAHRGCILV